MLMLFVVHVAAGSLALLTGYVALFAGKGDSLHRRSGLAFVVAMLTMCAAGATLAIVRDSGILVNVPAAITTAYLVWTSLTTVRPRPSGARHTETAAMIAMLAVALVTLGIGVRQVVTGERMYGIPAFPYFLFGLTGLVAVGGDVRVLRLGARKGRSRLARHLWRMTFALFIAAMSFFLGQAKVFPKPMRIGPLLAIPPLTALVVMLWWLWRVRSERWIVGIGSRRLRAEGA
jgi:uncharacterized membrane protein